jgi:exosortase D (VPLPA-CTERM-specific)
MSSVLTPPTLQIWRSAPRAWLAFVATAGLLAALFGVGLAELWKVWMTRPEFSFGVFVPAIVAFLIWQRKDQIERLDFRGSWSGLWLVALGILFRIAGDLAVSFLFVMYGFVLALMGLAICYFGRAGMKVLGVPLLFLFFMLPIPEFLLQGLSQRLQLISSWLGVSFIRLCNISVYQEGNLIDLGAMKLQVAEACSGLRYLFSLLVLGFIAAYFFKGAMWKRVLIFVSSIPITIFMNSFRIGLVGVTVEYFGKAAAEGVLHDFEGLVIFMGAMGLLIVEMWLLARIGKDKLPLSSAFGLDMPAPTPKGAATRYRTIPAALYAGVGLLAVATAAKAFVPERVPIKPTRETFAQFPLEIDGWRGRPQRLDKIYLDILKLDDYLIADYASAAGQGVNVYVQYFAAQDRDSSTHSPRLCIPAGGWEIARLERRELESVPFRGQPLAVNRAVITRGEATMLVYYWFQQRGRNSTNEYGTKMLILWDSITKNRSDGSMVRLITAPRSGESLEAADERLTRFARSFVPQLTPFIPE